MAQSASNYPDINDPNVFVLYRYQPSLVAAVIFIICFFTSTFVHIIQAFRKRTYYFIPLIIGSFFEWIGYIGRALGHFNQWELGTFIMQDLLLLLAPALFAASIYMILGRLIIFTQGEILAPIRPTRLTKIFVSGDCLAFVVQASGGGLMASSKTMTTGKLLVVTGLCLQVVFFGFFVICGGRFHHRILQSPTLASTNRSWKKYIYTLYATSIIILIRSVFRVVLFAESNDSFLMRNEVFLYIFDSVLMLSVMVLFNIIHPGAIFGRKKVDGDIIQMEESGSGNHNGLQERK